jgi:hypothetical protein
MKSTLALVIPWMATILAAGSAIAQTGAPSRVGVAAAVTGDVQLASATAPGARAIGAIRSGQDVFIGDRIATGPTGTMQVLLLDQTVFTIGPDASVTIDEFVFDPSSGQGRIDAAVSGSFRFVTGRIANTNPANMKVRMPVGTMGIRGTVVAGNAEPAHSLVILLGPGPDNNAAARIGRVFVENGNGPGVELVRPGFATEINGRGAAPGTPFRVDTARLDRLLDLLDGRLARSAAADVAEIEPAAGGGVGGDPTNESGEGQASGLVGVASAPGLTSGRPNSASPDQIGTTSLVTFTGALTPTTFKELGQVTKGSAVFPAQTFGLNMQGGDAGSYTVAMTIDFGQRETSGTLSFTAGPAMPRQGTSTFAIATKYTANGAPIFGPNDPAIQNFGNNFRLGDVNGTGEADFHYVPLKSGAGGTPTQLLSGVRLEQKDGGKIVAAVGAGVSTTSGTPIAVNVKEAHKILKLPPVK